MEITSSRPSNLPTYQLSLQEARSRSRTEGAIGAVTRRETRPEEQQQNAPRQHEIASRSSDPTVERKLANLGRVQFAFAAALKVGRAMEDDYLLDPIV